MRNKINILDKQIDRKDLEKFTRKLYIHRQKDRLKDEGGSGVKKKRIKTVNINIIEKAKGGKRR